MNYHTPQRTRGIATLLLVVVFVVGATTLAISLTSLSIVETRSARDTTHSIRSFFSSESILEDVALRTLDEDVSNNVTDTNAYDIYFDHDSINADVELRKDQEAGTERYTAGSAIDSAARNSSFRLVPRNQGSWSEDLQAGWLGIRMFNTASVKGQIFSNGPIRGFNALKNVLSIRPGAHIQVAPQRVGADAGGSNNTTPFNYIVFRDHDKKDNITQQFATSNTGYLSKIRLKIARTNYSTSWPELTFRIRENAMVDGKYVPGAAVGSPVTISGSNISTTFPVYSSPSAIPWYEINFSDQYIPISAGRPYWLEIHSVDCGGNCARYFYVAAQEGSAAQYPVVDAYGEAVPVKRPMVLWAQNNSGAVWCEPGTTGSFSGSTDCTEMNNTGYWDPTSGPSDIMFEVYISTTPTVIDNVIINTCSDGPDAGVCDGTPVNSCAGGNLVYVEAPLITNSTIYAKTNTYSAPAASTIQSGCPSDAGQFETTVLPGESYEIVATTTPFNTLTIDTWKKAAGWNKYDDAFTQYCGGLDGCSDGENLWVTSADKIFPEMTGNRNHAVIKGNLTLGNYTLTLRNFVYVKGNLTAGSGTNCLIQVSDTTPEIPEENSIVMVVEGTVDIGNCDVTGREGDSKSHLMIVSLSKNISDDAPAILLRTSTNADLVYAQSGLVRFNQSSSAQAVYGEGILFEQSAEIQSVVEGVGAIQFADTGSPEAQGEIETKGWGEQ